MAKKKEAGPNTPSMAWLEMAPVWHMMSTLLEGTRAMREAGVLYLPQHEAESGAAYQERLNATTLYNMTALTLDGLVGKPFSEPLELSADMPAEVAALVADLDSQGNAVTSVAREWLRESLAKAFSHVLVDMPHMSVEERVSRTRDDDIKEGRRPYWNLVCPENLIFAAAEMRNGVETLTEIRIREVVVDVVGWEEIVKHRVRVINPGEFRVYEEREIKNSKKTEWVLVSSGQTGINIVPLVTFYANRTGLMQGKLPLEDLAHLNVTHWQSSADQRNILTVSRFPMLAASGVGEQQSKELLIGPRQLLSVRDPAGRYYYVEHSGKAIKEGKDDIQDLENKMASYGAEFLRRKPGNETATGRALDSSEAMSPLQDIAVRFEEAMAKALDITATWLGLRGGGGSVKIVTEFKPDPDEPEKLKLLAAAFKDGAISAEEYKIELRRRDILEDPDDPSRGG